MTPHHDAALILDDYQRRAEYLPDSSPSDSGARAALLALMDDLNVMLALRVVHSDARKLKYDDVVAMTGAQCDVVRRCMCADLDNAADAIRAKIAVTE